MTSATFLIPTKCTISIIYITLMRNSYTFLCLCAFIMEINMTYKLQN